MRGDEMAEVRNKLGLARKDFGLLIGYGGNIDQIYKTVQRYEDEARPIPPTIARLVHLLEVVFDITGKIIEWPSNIDENPQDESCDTQQ